MCYKTLIFLLINIFLLTTIAIAKPNPSTLDGKKILFDGESGRESNEWQPVTESGVISRTPRAINNFKFPDPKHEVKVTSTPVKIYKDKEEYLNDMQSEETRPTRKAYGSVLDPGPYQEPLSILFPPSQPAYILQSSSPHTPQHTITIERQPAAEPIQRVYHLEDGFIPIVTNHGSAIVPIEFDNNGHPLNLASQVQNQQSNLETGEVINISNSDFRIRRKATPDHDIKHGEHQPASAKTFSKNSKNRGQTKRGRRGRKGKKRGSKSSQSSKSTNPSHGFKPIVHQRNPKKLQPLDRTPRQRSNPSSPAGPLRIIMSNQIVQVSQEPDRKYHFEYTGENGVSRIEDGYLKNPDGEKPVQVMKGSYSYIGPDDKVYTIHYIADENGYRATGSHLPVPP